MGRLGIQVYVAKQPEFSHLTGNKATGNVWPIGNLRPNARVPDSK